MLSISSWMLPSSFWAPRALYDRNYLGICSNPFNRIMLWLHRDFELTAFLASQLSSILGWISSSSETESVKRMSLSSWTLPCRGLHRVWLKEWWSPAQTLQARCTKSCSCRNLSLKRDVMSVLWLTLDLFVPGQCSRTSPRPHYLLYIHKCQSLLQRLLQSEDCSSALPQSHCRPLSSQRPGRPTQPRHDPKLSDCCCPRLPLCTQALLACPPWPSVPGRILVGGCCCLLCSVHRWRKDDWFSD